ncbi:MAG: FtsW/RodA/SpoVE family cell cycle protein, partial [Clostridium sp.]|nr:FtsW/RodA/SpoVE family cell cycle protein [Clostridium sp.]
MKMRKDERKLLILTYILCIGLFSNLAILSDPIDKKALIIGGALCLVIGYSHFVIRRFYPDGDKFLLIFAGILSVIGIAMLYRLETSLAIKQIVWFIVGIIVYILTVVIVPNIRSFAKYKTIYLVATLIFAPMALLLGKELNGAKNWVFLGQFGFQPSEFGKIFLVIYLASVLKDFDNTKKGFEHIKQLIQPAIVVMIFLGCLVLQRDLGSALIFFGISVSVLYIATSKKKYAFTCLGLFALGSSIAY